MVDQDRPDQVALALVGLAQLGALGLGVLDQAFDEVRAALADHRRDRAVVLEPPETLLQFCPLNTACPIVLSFCYKSRGKRVVCILILSCHCCWTATSVSSADRARPSTQRWHPLQLTACQGPARSAGNRVLCAQTARTSGLPTVRASMPLHTLATSSSATLSTTSTCPSACNHLSAVHCGMAKARHSRVCNHTEHAS